MPARGHGLALWTGPAGRPGFRNAGLRPGLGSASQHYERGKYSLWGGSCAAQIARAGV